MYIDYMDTFRVHRIKTCLSSLTNFSLFWDFFLSLQSSYCIHRKSKIPQMNQVIEVKQTTELNTTGVIDTTGLLYPCIEKKPGYGVWIFTRGTFEDEIDTVSGYLWSKVYAHTHLRINGSKPVPCQLPLMIARGAWRKALAWLLRRESTSVCENL